MVETEYLQQLERKVTMAFLVAVCIALLCLSLFKPEQCEDCGTEFDPTFVLEGEPVFLECSLLNSEDTDVAYNFTWFKKDRNISITTDSLSRIYVAEKTVAIFPVKLEDAGFYACVKRNSTNCWTKQVELIVYKNLEGFCYNPANMFGQPLFAQGNDRINCPGLDQFITPEQAHVVWLKECQPLNIDGKGIKPFGFSLQIENVTKADEGNYACSISYSHNGELFNVSRAIEVEVKVLEEEKPPVIIYPSDEKLYVKIGSPVQLFCNASCTTCNGVVLSWVVNNTFADKYVKSHRATLRKPFSSVSADGTTVQTLILDIPAVEKDDYGIKFVCKLESNSFRTTKAYIMLYPPAPDLQAPLIASFVALAFVILIAVATYKLFKIDIVLCYRHSLHPIINKKKASDGKIYDAYVMFPKGSEYHQVHTVDLFVQKALPEVLEKQCGYTLFIFGRDDLPGEAVADVIDEAVKKSRRLILILTRETSHKDFLYNEFEQCIALHDSLLSNKTQIILIELEKIDYSNVPESVKYIKGNRGTISWKGDFTGKEELSPNTRFWKRVRYRMPPAPGSSSGESSFIPAV